MGRSRLKNRCRWRDVHLSAAAASCSRCQKALERRMPWTRKSQCAWVQRLASWSQEYLAWIQTAAMVSSGLRWAAGFLGHGTYIAELLDQVVVFLRAELGSIRRDLWTIDRLDSWCSGARRKRRHLVDIIVRLGASHVAVWLRGHLRLSTREGSRQ